ncbi:MAG: hypothetical protein OES79_04560 [Planctomycetota bacterium]|nr:hypothetical protein [Planctomycetota bacterium]
MDLKCFATTLSVILLAGCSESYQPAKRDAPAASVENAPAANEPVANAPAANPHGAFGAAANPHGTFGAAAPAEHLGNQVETGAIQLTAPEQWVRRQPRSGFVMAEFSLPKAEGDEKDGRLTVSVAGGSIEANIDRWRGQFGSGPEKDSQKEIDVAGLKVTLVDFAGTFNEQAGPFAPGVTREGYRMLAAIIPAGDQLHFVKAYGPEKTMAAHVEAFHEFVKTTQAK